MPIRKTIAMLMAGGQGSRLSVLSELRAKPAVSFGGIYRIIDFTMSNAMHSRIPYVGICTQYRPYSLVEHISVGEAWGYSGRKRVARILQPFQAERELDWYEGTADAIYRNLNFINRFPECEYVIILSGDHIYHMDYQQMLQAHLDAKADLTIAVQEIPWNDVEQFGVVVTRSDDGASGDDDAKGQDRVIGFQEKPKENPQSNLANLGIYIFNLRTLKERLAEDSQTQGSSHDFGQDVIPQMVAAGDRVFAYRFDGFWRDVGTIHALWRTNLDVLKPAETGLDLAGWNVRTNWRSMGLGNQYPAKILAHGRASHSLVSRGCLIEGEVNESILSPGVHVGPGALVERSVLMNDVRIGPNAVVRDAIIDKEARIGEGAHFGEGDNTPNLERPHLMDQGVTLIGKRARVSDGIHFGRNTLIYPYAKANDFAESDYPSGSTIFNEKYKSRMSAAEFHAPTKRR
ncbi:glucose-1-phosphate adenylyltransferase family protein [Candidatus Sumerlaeota bacterium]